MDLRCTLGRHSWSGCKCARCGKERDGEHNWAADCDRCSRCGATRENAHNWRDDCEFCSKCGATRENVHDWSTDCNRCSKCGKTREVKHHWIGCKCTRCARTRAEGHDWQNCGRCARCGMQALDKGASQDCECAKCRRERDEWKDYKRLLSDEMERDTQDRAGKRSKGDTPRAGDGSRRIYQMHDPDLHRWVNTKLDSILCVLINWDAEGMEKSTLLTCMSHLLPGLDECHGVTLSIESASSQEAAIERIKRAGRQKRGMDLILCDSCSLLGFVQMNFVIFVETPSHRQPTGIRVLANEGMGDVLRIK